MSEIGIGFVFRASTAAFNKAVAGANNKIKDLKKELREGDVGGGIKRLLGAGAVIEGFRAVMNHAQEVRKSFEDMGRPIPENIRSIAAMADGVDGLKKGLLEAGTTGLGFFTKIGEGIGDKINDLTRFFGRETVDPKIGAKAERDADKQEAARDRKLLEMEQKNSPENLKKLDDQLAETRKKNAEAGMTDLEKYNNLMKEEEVLYKRLVALRANPSARQSQIKDAELADASKRGELEAANRARQKAKNGLHDEYLPTLHDLAGYQNSDYSGYRKMDPNAIAAAQKVESLEQKAQQAGFAGNFDLSDKLRLQAGGIRAGLGGLIKSDEVESGKQQVDLLKDAVGELKGLNEKAVGVIKISS